ncbi:MAG: histidine kinase, partial [Planctomycetaceae bacterium]|nr:histidine kinase [Planctomycetaceae bacterium]
LSALTQGGQPIDLGIVPERLEEVSLDWRQNFFEFEFAALNYTLPEKNRYAYMLEGVDTEWYYAGSRRFGRYTNIPDGSHTLRIKGSNNDDVWNEEGLAISVRVVPPFWRTWWFRISVVALLLGGAVGAFVLRVRLIEAQRYRLEIQVAERTRELKKARDAAQVANRAKSNFLSNMSHELRTPMNAIIGFTELMQRDTKLDDEMQDYLNIVNQSGDHLLALINNILDIAKVEA